MLFQGQHAMLPLREGMSRAVELLIKYDKVDETPFKG